MQQGCLIMDKQSKAKQIMNDADRPVGRVSVSQKWQQANELPARLAFRLPKSDKQGRI